MKTIFRNMIIAIALISMLGCSILGGSEGGGDTAQSDKPRDEAPDVPTGDQEALAEGNGAFAFDLYRMLKDETEGNLFYSPYSISLALAMTYAGARGSTETQMADVLHFTLPQDQLHPTFNYLDLVLASRGEGAEGRDDEGFRLNIANAIWGQTGHPFLDEFLDTLAVNYGAGMRLVDYIEDSEGARVTINDWVSDRTEGRIEDLIPEGALNSLTRLVLTNAIYFNAAWADPFEESATSDGPFTLIDGSEVTVPLMQQVESHRYGAGDGYQAIELMYDGYELSMVILLPDRDQFSAFEQTLDADTVQEIIADIEPGRLVALTMPSFEFESEFSLARTLQAMGMEDAFSSDADFSGMDGQRDLFISDVIHKAFVAVDEEGTEAAAATAVVMEAMAMPDPEEPVEMTIDHPFIFLIRDVETNTILFLGRVMDPS